MMALFGLLLFAGSAARTQSATVDLRGMIDSIALKPGGDSLIVVGTTPVRIPAGGTVGFPGVRLTVGELMAQAPAECRARGQSGLLRRDDCLRERQPAFTGTPVRVDAIRDASGTLTAETMTLLGPSDQITGAVTFVSTTDGYLRVGGQYGADAGGTMVRINDPSGAQSVQHGAACGNEGNCSPDSRFRLDTTNYSVVFTIGNPACVPADAVADGFCPAARRQAPAPSDLLPLQNGDHVSAHGAFAVIGGVRVLVAHTLVAEGSGLRSR